MRSSLVALAVLALTAVVLLAGPGGDDRYRVAAVFDTAEGIAPGFLVKAAGVEVGRVADVELQPDLTARIELEVDVEFAPFRADARCRILPQSLISEKYVDCRPGADPRPLETPAGSDLPTIEVSRTAVPVAVQDVLDIFAQPEPQRLRLLLNELGLSVAGRSGDINEILRRASPMLGQADRTLKIVNAQERELAKAVSDTDAVVARLAENDDDVRGFVARSADLVAATAPRREELRRAVRDLPDLLRAVRRTLPGLRRAARATTPLLVDLRAAAPGLREFTDVAQPFAKDATPAVAALFAAARSGRRSVRSTAPIARQLKTAARTSARPIDLVQTMAVDLRDRGVLEGLQRFAYTLSSLTSNYDGLSHLVTAQLTATTCPGTPDVPGCDGRFVAQARPARTARGKTTPKAPSKPRRPAGPTPPVPTTAGPAAGAPARPTSPAAGVQDLLDGILGGLGGRPGSPARPPASPDPDQPAAALLDFLLGR